MTKLRLSVKAARELGLVMGFSAASLGVGLYDYRIGMIVGGVVVAGASLYGMVRQ